MQVNSDGQTEYRRRHNPIWDELKDTLIEHGVRTYSIFLNAASDQLFAYVEFESEEQWQSIAQTEICQKWWKHMSDIMPSNPDSSPKSVELDEVFHLEARA